MVIEIKELDNSELSETILCQTYDDSDDDSITESSNDGNGSLQNDSYHLSDSDDDSDIEAVEVGQAVEVEVVENLERIDNSMKYCWVCFATREDDINALWVQPCLCRGTTKWVHQACLNRWIDEKQKGNSKASVACPQCNSKYIIMYPHRGLLLSIIDTLDNAVYKISPFVAVGVVLGSMYWCAVTYGALTVMVVIGRENGLSLMKEIDAVVLLLGLPAIPICLILGNMVRWEDLVLTFLRRHVFKLPLMKYILPSFNVSSEINSDTVQNLPPLSSTKSATRVLCSALCLPAIATICGRYLFPSVKSNLQRTLVGGITFIAIKGILSIYHKQQKYVMQKKRKVLDYYGEPSSSSHQQNTGKPG